MTGFVTRGSVEDLIAIANSLTDPRDAELVRQFAKERQHQGDSRVREVGQFSNSEKRTGQSSFSRPAQGE
jgi:hypothetical protein